MTHHYHQKLDQPNAGEGDGTRVGHFVCIFRLAYAIGHQQVVTIDEKILPEIIPRKFPRQVPLCLAFYYKIIDSGTYKDIKFYNQRIIKPISQ